MVPLQWREVADSTMTRQSYLVSPITGNPDIMCSLLLQWAVHNTYIIFLQKDVSLSLAMRNNEKNPDCGPLQGSWPRLCKSQCHKSQKSKNRKTTKAKQSKGLCSKLKETKRLVAMCE